jgi:NAD(P)-dependent dehydrogenase (short-subunit alcohol dehydrogenase family)
MRLRDKVVIITGAGGGQGRAAALLFSEEGARIVVNDYIDDMTQETVEMIRKEGGEAIAFTGDVSDSNSVKDMIGFTVKNYGRIDILYNNAATEVGDAPIVELEEKNWDRIIDVNLKSIYLSCKYAIPEMVRSGKGSIINISSVGALIGGEGLDAYTAAKGGVISLSRTLAVQLAPKNIRVNVICPGGVDTPMIRRLGNEFVEMAKRITPMGRVADPKEIAYLSLFLASDESSFVTGSIFVIDGGLTAQ